MGEGKRGCGERGTGDDGGGGDGGGSEGGTSGGDAGGGDGGGGEGASRWTVTTTGGVESTTDTLGSPSVPAMVAVNDGALTESTMLLTVMLKLGTRTIAAFEPAAAPVPVPVRSTDRI